MSFRYFLPFLALGTGLASRAQYSIHNILLPESMNRQVCISGTIYLDGKLYFASERCPSVFEYDTTAKTVARVIPTQPGQEFEMEGITSYHGKLYMVSENQVSVYEVDRNTGQTRVVQLDRPLPNKTRNGDGMEGIAGNETQRKFYLLRERNEEMTRSQIYTYSVRTKDDGTLYLQYESMMEIPLLSPQWRYSDICYDAANNRLLLLKSFSKGKLRQQFIESMAIDASGKLADTGPENLPVENFSGISNEYKDLDYSMNLEGITIDPAGNIWLVSDNTSGKAQCELSAKEKTILLQLKKK